MTTWLATKHRRTRGRAVLWLALLCAAGSIAGASPRPLGQVAFRSFTPEDGLSNLVVLAIAQDRDGAMWVGTDDGLFRIDGERVVRFGAEAGVSSPHVYALSSSPHGELCVGVEQGLVCGHDGMFATVPIAGSVHSFALSEDALWIATDRGLFVRHGGEPPVRAEAASGDVTLLWADAHGVIAGRGAALAVATPGGAWAPLELDLGPHADEVRELRRDAAGALWLRSASHVWRVAPGERRAQDVTYNLTPGTDVRFGHTMASSPTGELVLATQTGVATFRGDRWEMLGAARGLPTDSAHILYYDRDGELWVGSVGIHRQLGRGLIERYTASTGLPGEAAWSIARTAAGELLVGTSRCLAHVVDGRWACIRGSEGSVVRSIAVMPDGGVYFGGVPAVLHHRAPDGTVSDAARLGSATQVPRILSVAAASDGTLWISTDGGLWRLPPGAAGAPTPVMPPGGDPSRFISAIVPDGPRTWFAGHEGIRIYDGATWTRLTASDGLRATEVRYLARRRDGRMCVLYDQGLGVTCFRYADGALSELQHLAAPEGLDATMAYSLGEDRGGRLWIGSGSGLRIVSGDPTVAIDRFTARDGISGDDATAMAFWLDDDDGLWFGSSSGLTHVAAERYHGPPTPPSVRMLGLAVGARVVLAEHGAAPPVGGDHDLRASFIANYHVDADLEYQVRLRPRDQAWAIVKARELRVSSLAPGDYQLQIQARARGGAWGAVTSAPFAIPAAWWQSRWVWLAGGALGLALTFMLVLGWQRASLRLRTRLLAAQTDTSFRAFLASMPDVVIVQRADGGIYFNQAAQGLLGDHAERAGLWLLRRVHPGDRRRATELLRRSTTRTAAGLVELRVGGGEDWRDFEVTHQTIELVGALAHVLIGRDVTERRRLHAKMLIADRMVSLGTLAAGIGHEINNPLACVRGNLEVISELISGDDVATSRVDLEEAVRDALEGADRVRVIVRGLRSFNHTQQELRIEVSLDEVLEQAVRLTHNELRHRAELVLATEDVPLVLADPGRLTQVIINLLINASHALPPGAADHNQITLRTRTDHANGHAILEVEDHGVGMAPDVVAHAFDPFFTTKRVGEGTGLGLSICHGIITGLGGQITIASQLGRGTTVRISLPPSPTARSAPAPAPASSLAVAIAGRPRVLVVDDEPAVGNVLSRILRTDCDVTVLTGGEDALRRVARGERYDVIVTDVMMPMMTGLELRERLLVVAPRPRPARRVRHRRRVHSRHRRTPRAARRAPDDQAVRGHRAPPHRARRRRGARM